MWQKLCFNNHGQIGRKGAWEVEHSNARCNGGSDRLCNLYAAHITCNRQKGAGTTRTARGWHGRTKAPLSKTKKAEAQSGNRWGWGAVGAISGAALGGPAGFVIGALIGAVVGDGMKPE